VKKIVFLTLAEVIEIHTDQIERYGGSSGVRDINLLSSAVAMPYASFQSQFLHADIFEMAAAYAFHISQNHPFVDGNKRTALATALVFLELNGISLADPEEKLYDAMISLASGNIDKAGLAAILRELRRTSA
jgi:death on curing protein